MIKTNAELQKELKQYPADAKINATYSEDIKSGTIEVGYDDETNTVQIVGSEEDV